MLLRVQHSKTLRIKTERKINIKLGNMLPISAELDQERCTMTKNENKPEKIEPKNKAKLVQHTWLVTNLLGYVLMLTQIQWYMYLMSYMLNVANCTKINTSNKDFEKKVDRFAAVSQVYIKNIHELE